MDGIHFQHTEDAAGLHVHVLDGPKVLASATMLRDGSWVTPTNPAEAKAWARYGGRAARMAVGFRVWLHAAI